MQKRTSRFSQVNENVDFTKDISINIYNIIFKFSEHMV